MSELSQDDQDFIDKQYVDYLRNKTRENACVNGNTYGGCKSNVEEDWYSDKTDVIELLKACDHFTEPKEISYLLEVLFGAWESNEGHWLYIAQTWCPRPINRVIRAMVKQTDRGEKTIYNPPGYFTNLIKKRKKRKSF